MDRKSSTQMLEEMRQFGSFSAAEQRFIRRSLDVGLNRHDAIQLWARSDGERRQIEAQLKRYRMVEPIRSCIADADDPAGAECFLAPLIDLAAGDLEEARIQDFEAFRFLYERLLGPIVRPWLVSAFCAAAALPTIHPELRKQLLQSIPVQDAMAAGWSIRPALFFPQWVEKVAEAVN